MKIHCTEWVSLNPPIIKKQYFTTLESKDIEGERMRKSISGVDYTKKLSYLSKWKKETLHIYDSIFKQNFWVFDKQWKSSEVVEYLSQFSSGIIEHEIAAGRFWGLDKLDLDYKNSSLGVIWFTDLSTLVHEILHASKWVQENRGIKGNEEFQCYYSEWLYAVITKSYKKTYKRVKE